MPSINKFRVANVNFKNNTRRYDDVIIPANGLNVVIDGENGDGKTLYAQCAFQTIIPNSYFHPANTIARLFEDNNNTTMHSMIEWELDKGNEYDFMITGFCAKDAQKDNEEVQKSFEHFNYVILYKHDFKFSLESVPLKTEKDGKTSRMGYKQLKEYLKKLKENEKKCFTKVFSSKKDYLNFLYNYGINEAEWRLLFNTNKQEGGAEHYFTTNFKHPKDLICKEIIPIIESIDRYRLEDEMSNEQLAKSLLDINNNIKKLSKKSQRLNELNIVEDCLKRVMEFNNDLKRALEDKEATFVEVVKGYNKELEIINEISETISNLNLEKDTLEIESISIREGKEQVREEISTKENEKEQADEQLKDVDKIESILKNRARKEILLKDIANLKNQLEITTEELNKLQASKIEFNNKVKELNDLELEKRAENLYLEYKEMSISVNQKQLKLDNFNRTSDELLNKKRETESMYLYSLNKLNDLLTENISLIDLEIEESDKNIKNNIDELISSEGKIKEFTLNIDNNNKEIENYKQEIQNLSDKEDSLNNDNSNIVKEMQDLLENIYPKESLTVLKDYINDITTKVKLEQIEDLKDGLIEGALRELYNHSVDITRALNVFKDDRTKLENDSLKSELEKDINSIQSKIKELSDKEKEMSQEISELKLSLKSNEYKVETLSKELGNYSKDITSISLILDDLKLDNRFDCELKLIDKTSLLKSELFNLELKINELNSKLKDLENNEGLSLANELIDNFELVLDVYPSAMLGRDFIKSLSIEDKDIYLSKTTLIPYSIVLNDQDYKALLKNSSLQEKMGDFLTPIINLTAIKSNSRIDTSIMYFNTLSKEVFIDEDRRLEEISKLEKELLKEENAYTKLEEELKATEKQLKDISLVNSKYDDNFEEAKNKELLDLKENTSTIEKDIEYKNKSLLDLDEEKSKLDKDIEDIKNKIVEHEEFLKRETSKINAYIDDLQEDTLINNLNTEKLNKLNSKAELYLANKVSKKECVESKNKLNEDINTKIKSIESLKSDIHTLNLEIASIKATRLQLEEVKKEKENLKAENTLKLKEVDRYKKEIPDGTKEKETNLSVEELREQVDIFNRNYKKEFSQIEELEKEIKHTKDNISRKKVEIESLKVSFEELDSRADMIIYNDINIFNSISKRLDSINAQIDELNKSIESTNTKKIQTETTIDNKTLDMNSINTYDEVVIEEGYNVEQKRNEINTLIDAIKTTIKGLKDKLKKLENKEDNNREKIQELSNELMQEDSNLREYEGFKEKTETLISLNKINVNITNEVANDIDFVVNKASKQIEWQNKNIKDIEFKHSREINETYDKLQDSVFEFVVVLKDINPPTTLEEIKEQNNNIASDEGYLYYLNQERNSLNKELEDLSLMKNEFINKCVHNVETLIEKLKKLSKQSTVVLNDKKIKLLDLKINELSFDQKVEKMTYHMDKLLSDIEDKVEENPEECIKLLNSELTASKLLEQGVKNLKNCEVNIYIPDSVNIENGYYERWGGGASGGQRNMMYFTTVMALIVFIRESSSLNGATQNTKVLFGDGPFRGSAALYLWEPAFKMMQENNIQFVVTNYGTPAHLTNLFSSRALLVGVESQLNGKRIIQNELSMDSIFKENTKSLRGENILVKYEDYKIPVVRKTAIKENEVDDGQISLDDLFNI